MLQARSQCHSEVSMAWDIPTVKQEHSRVAMQDETDMQGASRI